MHKRPPGSYPRAGAEQRRLAGLGVLDMDVQLLRKEIHDLEAVCAHFQTPAAPLQQSMQSKLGAVHGATMADAHRLEVALQVVRCDETAADLLLLSSIRHADELLRGISTRLITAESKLCQLRGEKS